MKFGDFGEILTGVRSRKCKKLSDRPARTLDGTHWTRQRQSLLLRAQNGEENAWKDVTDLYRPLVFGWLNRQGVPASDLEDLSQEVLLSVVKHLPTFQFSGQRGAFRTWLRTIVCRRAADYWRRSTRRPRPRAAAALSRPSNRSPTPTAS